MFTRKTQYENFIFGALPFVSLVANQCNSTFKKGKKSGTHFLPFESNLILCLCKSDSS